MALSGNGLATATPGGANNGNTLGRRAAGGIGVGRQRRASEVAAATDTAADLDPAALAFAGVNVWTLVLGGLALAFAGGSMLSLRQASASTRPSTIERSPDRGVD